MANFQRIRELCLKKNIQLKELAKEINMTEVGLQDLLKRNSTKTETIEKIAKFLNVQVGYYFNETPSGDQVVSGSGNMTISANGASVGSALLVHAPASAVEVEVELLRKELEGLKKELEAKDKLIALYEKMGK